jgi:outer membrane lipoprotein-sorting protein
VGGRRSAHRAAAEGERELRDRDLAKEKYIDLSGKLGKAEIAQEMEGRKQGDQRVMIYDGNRMRIEFLDGDSITSIWIQDLKRHSVLTLQPATKRWSLSEQSGTDALEQDYFTRVRQYRQGNAKQLPDREIGGKRMLSFEVEHAIAGSLREDWTIFADPESKLPQRIESVVKDLQGKILTKYVCKDFNYERLDESLFSFDPPEGYEHLHVPLPPKRIPEKGTL